MVSELTKDVSSTKDHHGAASAARRCDRLMLLLWHSCGSPPTRLKRCKLCSVRYLSSSNALRDEHRVWTVRSPLATASALPRFGTHRVDGPAAIGTEPRVWEESGQIPRLDILRLELVTRPAGSTLGPHRQRPLSVPTQKWVECRRSAGGVPKPSAFPIRASVRSKFLRDVGV